MPASSTTSQRRSGLTTFFGIILALIGLVLAIGGAELVSLDGSWYYLAAGIGLVLSGVLFAAGSVLGFWLYLLVFLGTLIWSFWEAGFAFWPLVPRLAPVLVLAFFALLLLPRLRDGRGRAASLLLATLTLAVVVAGGYYMFQPHPIIQADNSAEPDKLATAPEHPADPKAATWQYYGRTPAGTRFAPFTQINKDNVAKLEVAWTFRTGDIASTGAEDQSTPLQVGDTVYVCTPFNKVFALDAESGKQRWKYDPKVFDSKIWNRCRGVGYYDASQSSQPATVVQSADAASGAPASGGTCARRIMLTTLDARLIALDATTGQPCEGFGEHGTVDLKVGMGDIPKYFYMPTSAPTVMRNMVLVGGWVFDGKAVGEPSGVVRAFNADTGELAWAWDLGNPDITGLPPEGESYTRGTPNVWSTPAFDDKLGLVYLPTGNGTPDYWGAHRSEATEKYSASVVALDINTGRLKWHFQTAHHDLWDYDLPSQPALYDIPDGKGGTTPALIQLTKRGQIFLLNRVTGEPIADVIEQPVPQHHQEGDWVSPTQPYSVGMPAIGAEPLSEAKMWGATFFDQLWCRIEFRKMRYEGEFTAPTTEKTLQYPGNYGGFNWGSASINEDTGYLFVNDIRMPQWLYYIPRADADAPGAASSHDGLHVQAGTPYGVTKNTFMSPLGIPCHQPPWGTMTAIDLQKRQIVWERPMSTLQDTAVAGGLKVNLPIPIGMPTMGGPLSTASGLVFFAGTQDYYLRALDAATGKELWKGRLPVGGQATPMTYISPESGRQFVVIAAGGARQSPDRGDYIVAYSLPEQ
jgi:quinate dehydrogenase (quinone)